MVFSFSPSFVQMQSCLSLEPLQNFPEPRDTMHCALRTTQNLHLYTPLMRLEHMKALPTGQIPNHTRVKGSKRPQNRILEWSCLQNQRPSGCSATGECK